AGRAFNVALNVTCKSDCRHKRLCRWPERQLKVNHTFGAGLHDDILGQFVWFLVVVLLKTLDITSPGHTLMPHPDAVVPRGDVRDHKGPGLVCSRYIWMTGDKHVSIHPCMTRLTCEINNPRLRQCLLDRRSLPANRLRNIEDGLHPIICHLQTV